MDNLTEKEYKLLSDIKYHLNSEGHFPSYSKLGDAYGVSKMAICKTIKRLRAKGYLSENNQLLNQDNTTLPYIGKIAAGKPIDAFEVIEQLSLNKLLSAPNLFLLEVSGDSMIESGILDGDLVLIQQQNEIKNGYVVVALIDQTEATLKEIKVNQDNTITLIPHNQSMKPVTYQKEQVQIQGIYCGARFDKSCFSQKTVNNW